MMQVEGQVKTSQEELTRKDKELNELRVSPMWLQLRSAMHGDYSHTIVLDCVEFCGIVGDKLGIYN